MEKINAALEGNTDLEEEELLKAAPSQVSNAEDFYEGSVFDSTIELYTHLKQEMLSTLKKVVMEEIKDVCWNYQNEKWLTLPSQKDYISPSMTPSFCEVLQTCKTRLQQVQELLTASLFNTFWESVAESLGQYIFDRVILNGQFNEGGAKQLRYDITKGLYPVFSDFTSRPETYFKILKDCCILLNLSHGSFKLLNGVLLEEDADKGREALNDMKVYKLSIYQALKVMKLRPDLQK